MSVFINYDAIQNTKIKIHHHVQHHLHISQSPGSNHRPTQLICSLARSRRFPIHPLLTINIHIVTILMRINCPRQYHAIMRHTYSHDISLTIQNAVIQINYIVPSKPVQYYKLYRQIKAQLPITRPHKKLLPSKCQEPSLQQSNNQSFFCVRQ